MTKSDIIGILSYTILLLLFVMFADIIPKWVVPFIIWVAYFMGYLIGKSKDR